MIKTKTRKKVAFASIFDDTKHVGHSQLRKFGGDSQIVETLRQLLCIPV